MISVWKVLNEIPESGSLNRSYSMQ